MIIALRKESVRGGKQICISMILFPSSSFWTMFGVGLLSSGHGRYVQMPMRIVGADELSLIKVLSIKSESSDAEDLDVQFLPRCN